MYRSHDPQLQEATAKFHRILKMNKRGKSAASSRQQGQDYRYLVLSPMAFYNIPRIFLTRAQPSVTVLLVFELQRDSKYDKS
mmetsp:Transcript_6405/g.13244  ORF Transcript_6405/g.13244 Transcript_6405/m.13244 type:complete len:82 (-) Transcript_6405:187-432(-)